MRFFIITAAAVILLLNINTAQAEKLVLNFESAKNMVLKNSRLIKAYEMEAEAARFNYYQAGSGYSPKVNLSHTYMNTDEPANAAFAKMAQGRFDMTYFTTQLADPTDRVINHQSKIEVVQPIIMGGKLYYGVKQAKQGELAALNQKERVKEAVLMNFYKAFYGLNLAKRAFNVAKASHERTLKYYQMTKNFFDNGLIVKSDLLVAESYLLGAEQQIKEAEKNLIVAKSHLQRLLDTEDDVDVECDYSLINTDKELKFYKAQALVSRSDLRAMTNMAKIAKYENSKAAAGNLPDIVLFADYQRNDKKAFGKNGEGTSFGAKFSFNVFNGGKDYNSYRATKRKEYAANHRIADMRLKIKSEVKNAFYSVETARLNHETAKKMLESSKAALEIVENRFAEGLSKVTELLDREVEAKQADLNVCMSQYRLIIEQANLLFSTGILK